MQSYIAGPDPIHLSAIPDNLGRYIQTLVDVNPEGRFTAIDSEGQVQSVSYIDLLLRANQLASVFRAAQLDPNSQMVLVLDDVVDFVAGAWACIFNGYAWLPWSTVDALKNTEAFERGLQGLLEQLEHPLLITNQSGEALIQALSQDPTPRCVNIERLDVTEQNAPIHPTVDSGMGEVIVTTSGTSGEAKLARIPYSVMLNRYFQAVSAQGANLLICFPLHSISGLGVLFPRGAQMVYCHHECLTGRPQAILQAIEEYAIQWLGLSSYIAQILVEAIDRRALSYRFTALQGLVFGADYIVPQVVENLVLRFRRFGAEKITLSFVYGMTECGSICRSESLVDDFLQARQHGRQSLLEIGQCTSGVRLKVVDQASAILTEGETGRIMVKAPGRLFSAYYRDPDLTRQSLLDDGWFQTGDLGTINDGKLTITGREQHKLIIDSKSFAVAELETPLHALSGVKPSSIFIASCLLDQSKSAELAVFFVPESFADESLRQLCQRISQTLAAHGRVQIKHLIAVADHELERTETGKIKRQRMVEQYLQGRWSNRQTVTPLVQSQILTESQAWLSQLWQTLLKLESAPGPDENFFLLGGDSLTASILVAELEKKYHRSLSLERFYRHPTVNTVIKLTEKDADAVEENDAIQASQQHNVAPASNAFDLIEAMQKHVESWRGSRLFVDSLLVGMNTEGHKPPIIWVFQWFEELQKLAKALGPEQPIYGLRSCVVIYKISEYTEVNLRPLVDRYLWEILALPVHGPLIIAGNCQGGIIALMLAKLLKKIAKTPARLVLMEWMYSYGRYTDATLLLYGRDSNTARLYRDPDNAAINWRVDFPNHSVASFSGAHNEFFKPANVQSLAEVLTANL